MPKLLNHLVEEAALRQPGAAAVRCAGASVSYADLARQANGLAHVLRAAGLSRGDRVAVWLGKGPRVPVAFYGVLAAGGTLVPIDPRAASEQAIGILRATGASHLVSEPGRAAAVRKVRAACPDIAHVLGLEPGEAATAAGASWSTIASEAADRGPDAAVIELDPAYILHTSGSTGAPKLILHTHHSAMSFVEWAAAEYDLRPGDRITNHSSHHTCFATFDYYAAARAGAATVILTPELLMTPASLSAHLEQEQVSVWYSVPAALVQLSLRGALESRDLRALRWVLFAGETFPARHLRRLREQLPQARFSHVYGSTEVNVCTVYHLPPGDVAGPLPIGRACSTARTLVVDADLRPVPPEETGELLVRGSTVMSGYWRDPERNSQVLVTLPGPGGIGEVYFRTGDRTRLGADGQLAFVARDDRQVKVRGHRVELQEVEGALLSLACVEEAAVVTVPDGEGSSLLHAVVVLARAEPRVSEREMLADLRAMLPPYALPAQIAIVETLPRTPTGKVDARALAATAVQASGHGG